MSKRVGDQLPEDLYDMLRGTDLAAHKDKTILIATTDSEGWAHPAMLSYAEVVAKDRNTIRLASYKDSKSTFNMKRNSKLTLVFVDEKLSYYVKGTAQEIKASVEDLPYLSIMNVHVEQVLEDKASEEFEPGVYIRTGITFYNPRDLEFLSRGEKTLRALLKA